MTCVAGLLALLFGMGVAAQAQTAMYSGSTSAFDTTTSLGPQGIATDASGNLFIADTNTETVYERVRTGPGVYGAPTALPAPTPNYVFLRGLAIDPSGNLWVADYANGSGGQVYEYASGSFASAPVKVGSGWTAPWGIAADASGNVWVADSGANSISEISAGTVTMTIPGSSSGISAPRGIEIDSLGNLFVVDGNVGKVLTLPSPYTGAATQINTMGFQGAGLIYLDKSNNVWLTEYSTNLVHEMMASDSYATILNWGSGLSGPVAVWPSADGTLLVSNFANGNNGGIAQIFTGAVNFGTIAVNSTSATQTFAFTFTGAGNTTIGSPKVVTKGATGQDFADALSGTCTTTNGVGHPYAPGSSCTVVVNLKPKAAGPRNGAVQLVNSSGTVLASALVYGNGSGPEVVFPSNTTRLTLGGGFTEPFGLARDGSGNVYVADRAGNAVTEIPVGCTSGGCVVTLGGGFSTPAGVAVDGNGNIYVADFGNGAVKVMPAGCASSGCVTTLGGGFSHPFGVAVDGSGNVYVADNGMDAVDKMPAGCSSASCVTPLGGGGFGSTTGVAVDGSGNVYVIGSGSVKEMTPGCTSGACVTSLGGGFNTPLGIALDGSGNVYISDFGTNEVNEMPPGCNSSSCVTILGSGFNGPAGVMLDDSGNVYVADKGNIAVKEMTLATPPSLSFAATSIGSQSSDSPKAVTVANIGNAPLTFPVPDSGQNPSASTNFSVDASTTCPVVLSSGTALSLAAGANCALEVDFIPQTNLYTGTVVLTDDNLNASPATQSIALSGGGATVLAPWIQVNGGSWRQISTVTVNAGDSVNLGEQNLTGGTYSWSGPGGYTSTSALASNVPLTSTSNVFTLTYTNTSGIASTQTFTINVSGTALTPYIQVNNGGWQQVSTVTVSPGDTVNLGEQVLSGGSYSWSGPGGYTSTSRLATGVPLSSATNVFTLTYTNTIGATSTLTFTVNVGSTPLTPYAQVNNGGWQQVSTVSATPGDTVNLGEQVLTGGTYSWSGPGGYTSTSRIATGVPLTSASNVFTLTYTNSVGATSTLTFTVNVGSTPLSPYLQVNGGAWQQTNTVSVTPSDSVNLSEQVLTGGTYSWSGPGGYTSTSRIASNIPLTSATETFTLTYTNSVGATSTATFTVHVGSTPLTPYLEVNGGAWQQTNTVSVTPGDAVNLSEQVLTGGSYSWSGPGGYTSTSRIASNVPLTSATETFTLTYTNSVGATSTATFTVHVGSTPLTPYLEVNGGAWQQTNTVTVSTADTVNLGEQVLTGGTYSWTGTGGYSSTSRIASNIPLTSATETFTLTYTNSVGATSTATFTVHVGSTPLTPWIQANNGAWQQINTVTVPPGSAVNLSEQVLTGGTYSWSGPGGYTSTSRIASNVPINSATNTFTLTYTNSVGATSTATFTVKLGSTPLTPYMQVNGGGWVQTSAQTVTLPAAVDLGEQVLTGGSYSWSGPGGFTATTRLVTSVPLSSGTNVFTLTYTNTAGATSTATYTITAH